MAAIAAPPAGSREADRGQIQRPLEVCAAAVSFPPSRVSDQPPDPALIVAFAWLPEAIGEQIVVAGGARGVSGQGDPGGAPAPGPDGRHSGAGGSRSAAASSATGRLPAPSTSQVLQRAVARPLRERGLPFLSWRNTWFGTPSLDSSDTPESNRAWRTLPYYGLTTCSGSWPASARAMFSDDSIMILCTLSGDRPAM
jgi:hypothetical protein